MTEVNGGMENASKVRAECWLLLIGTEKAPADLVETPWAEAVAVAACRKSCLATAWKASGSKTRDGLDLLFCFCLLTVEDGEFGLGEFGLGEVKASGDHETFVDRIFGGFDCWGGCSSSEDVKTA